MPVMALTVAFVSLLAERLWVVLPGSLYFDSFDSVMLTLALVAGGAAIAFMMVWVEFTVIKLTSALTFMVAGTFKEIVTVLAAVAFLGESFSKINAAGLAVLVAGVALFNWTKYRKVAAEQREAAEAAAEAAEKAEEEAARRASSVLHNNPSAAAASAYETFVPSSIANNVVGVGGAGAVAAAAARKRRGGGIGLGLELNTPSSSSTAASTPTVDAERATGATPPPPPVAGGPGGSPLRGPRAAGSSLAPAAAAAGAGSERGGGERGEG